MFRSSTFLSALALLVGCSQGPASNASDGPDKLSDDDIAAYAAKVRQASFRQTVTFERKILGLHNGAKVGADFPCSDDCPQNTLGIVHYDLPPGEPCKRVGGVVRLEWVPAAIAVSQEPYCVPKVLVDRRIQTEPFE